LLSSGLGDRAGAADHDALGDKAVATLKEHGLEGHGYTTDGNMLLNGDLEDKDEA